MKTQPSVPENPTTESKHMSLKGAEAFLRSHVPVQHAIRKLLESSEPLALMKLANMGPREKRSEVWPALEDLRKGGVLEASESNVMDLRTVAVRIAAKYRETLARIILSGNKKEEKNEKDPAASKARPDNGRDEYLLKDPNNLLAIKILINAKGEITMEEVNEESGLAGQQKRHAFWAKMRDKKWISQNDGVVYLTARGEKPCEKLIAELGHTIPKEWMEDEA